MMIKVIVFDFDGVIVDSNELKHTAFFNLFSESDIKAKEVVRNVLSRIGNGTRFDILRQIFIDLGEAADKTEVLINDYAEKYNNKVRQGILDRGLKGGVLDTLEFLSQNYKFYINSGTPEPALKENVVGLGIERFFKGIYGRPFSGEFVVHKEINLRKIIANENVTEKEIVMIGDDEGDYQAARNLNCRFIGVVNDFNDWKEKDCPSVSNFGEIVKIIKSY